MHIGYSQNMIKYISLSELHVDTQSAKTEAYNTIRIEKQKYLPTFWHEGEHVILDVGQHRIELCRSDAASDPQNGTAHKIIA